MVRSLLVLLTAAGGRAEVVTIPASADTCLFEWTADYNFGAQVDLPAGGLGAQAGSLRLARALYKYDVAAAVPAGAVVTAARVRLHVTQAPENSRISDFALHRVLVDWGEGSKTGDQPGGAAATAGEATWNMRLHPSEPWSAPGGRFGVDFASDPSALKDRVNAVGDYIFVLNGNGVADVQSMLEDPARNFGWVLYSLGEDERKTARRWSSREAGANPPVLEITWSMPVSPPEITAVELNPARDAILIQVQGVAGFRYTLQTSGDLIAWTPGEVQSPTADGELVFALPIDGAAHVRVEATRTP